MKATHAIVETRFFYGPKSIRHVPVYGTPEECQAWIERHDSQVYWTAHNEAGRPSHEIVPIGSITADDLESAFPANEDFSWNEMTA